MNIFISYQFLTKDGSIGSSQVTFENCSGFPENAEEVRKFTEQLTELRHGAKCVIINMIPLGNALTRPPIEQDESLVTKLNWNHR